MYRHKAIFAFLPRDNKNLDDIWALDPTDKKLHFEYNAGIGIDIGGRRFVSYNQIGELSNLLFMLIGKKGSIYGFYYHKSGGLGVYVGFPSNVLYKDESICDCDDSQFIYDSMNYLIIREGQIGTHINTEAAMALKRQIEANRQRRMNANDLLAGL